MLRRKLSKRQSYKKFVKGGRVYAINSPKTTPRGGIRL